MRALIVGAGLSGATAARILLDNGWDVEVYEKNDYLSGSCLDKRDEETGNMVHVFGPHAFHTRNPKLWQWVNRFDYFIPFPLRVSAITQSKDVIPIPFNHVSRDIVGDWDVERIIRELFVTYSEKMWGEDWDKLPASITARVPKKRESTDTRYHLDELQGIPEQGYTAMITKMLEGAKIATSCKEDDWRWKRRNLLIYTGRAEEYFGIEPLPWRSLDFHWTTEKSIGHNQLNACHREVSWHRAVDHSFWPNSHKHKDGLARISREVAVPFQEGVNNAYYPEPHKAEGRDKEIREMCKAERKTLFLGRLATYRYISMDEAIMSVHTRLSKEGLLHCVR